MDTRGARSAQRRARKRIVTSSTPSHSPSMAVSWNCSSFSAACWRCMFAIASFSFCQECDGRRLTSEPSCLHTVCATYVLGSSWHRRGSLPLTASTAREAAEPGSQQQACRDQFPQCCRTSFEALPILCSGTQDCPPCTSSTEGSVNVASTMQPRVAREPRHAQAARQASRMELSARDTGTQT